jgi:hypothetical protein
VAIHEGANGTGGEHHHGGRPESRL